MPESVHEHVGAYIDAAVKTTTRSREILILIIIVSVLVFGAFWNSRQGSWINARVGLLTAAKELRELETARDRLPPNSPQRLGIEMTLNHRRFDGAREYLDLRPSLKDVETIKLVKAKLEDLQTEHVYYVKLPFFGLFMDVNDLGMLGGFTFIVLLLWFRSSLWHELQNLTITFAEAKTHRERHFCYEAMSMQQVLTMPASLTGDDLRGRHWGLIVKALLLLPLVVHLTVFCYDSMSFQFGWSISPANTIIGTTVSALFLVVIVWLTALCFMLSAKVNDVWRTTAEEIRKAPPEERSR